MRMWAGVDLPGLHTSSWSWVCWRWRQCCSSRTWSTQTWRSTTTCRRWWMVFGRTPEGGSARMPGGRLRTGGDGWECPSHSRWLQQDFPFSELSRNRRLCKIWWRGRAREPRQKVRSGISPRAFRVHAAAGDVLGPTKGSFVVPFWRIEHGWGSEVRSPHRLLRLFHWSHLNRGSMLCSRPQSDCTPARMEPGSVVQQLRVIDISSYIINKYNPFDNFLTPIWHSNDLMSHSNLKFSYLILNHCMN